MSSKIFYDGTKILSMLDIDNKKPEIYMIVSNRSAGKTTYFGRYFVNRFLKYNEKFILLYRYKYEMEEANEKFFKEIGSLFFPSMKMSQQTGAKNVYNNIFLDSVHCGYVICINAADNIKKLSHLFSDSQRILFDEFQSETNSYCPNEIQKFISIHTSIARGGGKQVRYLPIFMLSNPVSLVNPYYEALGIAARLQTDTKFLKGKGYVFEHHYNESSSKLQSQSSFNTAFAGSSYIGYSTHNIYLNDDNTFISKIKGNARYLCTLRHNGKNYGVRTFNEQGIIYISTSADMSFPLKLAITNDDMQINYILLRSNNYYISLLKYYFNKGLFRFENLECKNVIFNLFK